MKAVVYKNYGTADVLQVMEIAKPEPKDDEVLFKVHAAEVTKGDCEMRSFKFQVKWFWLPLRIAFGMKKPKKQVLGGYFAGEVERVGKEVSKFKPGDRVLVWRDSAWVPMGNLCACQLITRFCQYRPISVLRRPPRCPWAG